MPDDATVTPEVTAPLLQIDDLHVSVEGQPILRGVDLTVDGAGPRRRWGPTAPASRPWPMSCSAIRPTRSRPAQSASGERTSPRGHRRPGQGRAVPGLPGARVHRAACRSSSSSARPCPPGGAIDMSVLEVRLMMMEWMEKLGMDPAFGERHLNEGFSGGEKKRNEILQMAILEPELADPRRDGLRARRRRPQDGGPRGPHRSRGPARPRACW